MNIVPGVIGGVVAGLLVAWLTTRSVPTARSRNGRFIVEYSLAAKIAAWFLLALGFFIAYAACRASADQRVLAACVGGTLFLAAIVMFIEFHFAHVEFDDNSILHVFTLAKASCYPVERCN